MKKFATVAVLAMSVSAGLQAADAGSGRVTFTGSIIDAACSVNPESSNQEVNLGQIALHQLEGKGTSTPRNFEIALENCSVDTQSSVSVTFAGAKVAKDLLGITGTAAGAGIAITDGTGERLELGKPSAARELVAGNNTMIFSAYLEGLGDDDKLKTGDFYAVADFTLAYE
ncbi:fimbrial protein [Aeromonas simiae]|uniref:fimbrial protein n=1 Tax=Aeromonas simiae TaxID=218936 RepID=UPI0038D13EF2